MQIVSNEKAYKAAKHAINEMFQERTVSHIDILKFMLKMLKEMHANEEKGHPT